MTGLLIIPRQLSSFSSFTNLTSNKSNIKLSDSRFWDKQHRDLPKTEWYIKSNVAAGYLRRVMVDKNLLCSLRSNLLVEIGCGTFPVVIPLKKVFEKSKFMVTSIATDGSNVCLSQVKDRYSNNLRDSKRTFRQDESGEISWLLISKGVYLKTLDIKDINLFMKSLNHFPIPNINFYKTTTQIQDDKGFETNQIIVDKGCLDALIWDRNNELIEKVLNSSNSIVSISGEDPDIRLDYLQSEFGKRFSVHFTNNPSVFVYSHVHKNPE